MVSVSAKSEENCIDQLIDRCGTLNKLKRVIGHCCRFIDGLKKGTTPEKLRLCHLKRAETIILRHVQKQTFSDEFQKLLKCIPVGKSSPLRWYSPMLDENKLIRVGGRLSNADLEHSAQHPVVVSGQHRLASMIAEHYHKIMLHSGLRLTSTTINQKYWILGGRRVIKNAIHNCVRCARCRPKLVQQPMADLPMSRVRQAKPFAITGVDYAGPIYVKGGHRRATAVKAYVSIFVCFVTKATHIELVSELTTLAFLAALRRFVARRGLVAEIYSDNGTNFRGASNHLCELVEFLRSESHQDKTTEWCYERGIKWSFSPPSSPHFGGLWEAVVKSMKHHLIRVVGSAKLTFENMATLLVEVEACLNSRPLTQLSDDPNDVEALTPGHFLIGCNLKTLPDVNLEEINVNRLNHWRQVQHYMQNIWRRWHLEYLQELQRKTKWNKAPMKINPGMLVVVQEDNLPVSRWPLARIQEVHPGKDNIVRVVTVNFGNNKIGRRTVTKIAILPVFD